MAKFRRKPMEVDAITFDDLVAYGVERCKAEGREGNIINGMPLSFDYRGRRVTHENDNCYIVGSLVMGRDDVLFSRPDGSVFRILRTVEFLADFEPVPHGVVGAAPWEVKVHCSKGERTLRAGMRWRDGLHGSTWEVMEPEGSRIYSPSGLGGTPTFWCRPVGVLPAGAERLLDGHREDGCVSFCGDSIVAGLIRSDGLPGADQPQQEKP